MTKLKEQVSLKSLLHTMLRHEASDLHLRADSPPMFRIHGKIVFGKTDVISGDGIEKIIFAILNEKQKSLLEVKRQIDISFNHATLGRFRACIYYQKGSMAVVFRVISSRIPTLSELNLPKTLQDLLEKKSGIILITGTTGSGKSTTLASMVSFVNNKKSYHVVLIEDPIEYIHVDNKCTISQREIGIDGDNIHDCIMGSLRQDPDIIAIGEVRKHDEIEEAIIAAETGHLVLTTMHTGDARSTIDRIIDAAPDVSKNQIRMQISHTLVGIVSQKLVDRADGRGRIPVCEVLINSPTIQKYIQNNDLNKISEVMSHSNEYYKMQTFNQALEKLVMEKVITEQTALAASNSPDDLRMRFSGFKKNELAAV